MKHIRLSVRMVLLYCSENTPTNNLEVNTPASRLVSGLYSLPGAARERKNGFISYPHSKKLSCLCTTRGMVAWPVSMYVNLARVFYGLLSDKVQTSSSLTGKKCVSEIFDQQEKRQ